MLSGENCSTVVTNDSMSADPPAEWTCIRREFYDNALARKREKWRKSLHQKALFGQKTIGKWGSYVYLINQIFGTAIVAIPLAVKVGGLLPSFFSNVFLCLMSSLCALMVMRSMTMIPGNQNFQKRFEYITTAGHYIKNSSLIFFTGLTFHLSIQSLNVISIAVVSQAVDRLLCFVADFTYALVVYPRIELKRYTMNEAEGLIYGESTGNLELCISLGYVLNAVVCIFLSSWNLEENMLVQYLSFCFLIFSIVEMVIGAIMKITRDVGETKKMVNITNQQIRIEAMQNEVLSRGVKECNSYIPLGTFSKDNYQLTACKNISLNYDASYIVQGVPTVPQKIQKNSTSSLSPESPPFVPAWSFSHLPASATIPSVFCLLSCLFRRKKGGQERKRTHLRTTLYGVPPPRTEFFNQFLEAGSTTVKKSGVSRPSLLGSKQYSEVFSTFIASYSFVNVIPSWANEITPNVKVNQVIWGSSFFCCVVYYIFGVLLATAYPSVSTENVLNEMLRDDSTGFFTRFSIYIFDLLTIAPSILVYCISTRYNLLNSGLCGPKNSFLLGSVAPFAVSWLLSKGQFFSNVLTWSSLIFSLICNFLVPGVIYILACSSTAVSKRCKTFRPDVRRNIMGRTAGACELRRNIWSWLNQLKEGEATEKDMDPQLIALMSRSSEGSVFSQRCSKPWYSQIRNGMVDTSRHFEHDDTTKMKMEPLLWSCNTCCNSNQILFDEKSLVPTRFNSDMRHHLEFTPKSSQTSAIQAKNHNFVFPEDRRRRSTSIMVASNFLRNNPQEKTASRLPYQAPKNLCVKKLRLLSPHSDVSKPLMRWSTEYKTPPNICIASKERRFSGTTVGPEGGTYTEDAFLTSLDDIEQDSIELSKSVYVAFHSSSSLPAIQIHTSTDLLNDFDDAYAVDDDVLTGDFKPIRIHVYPAGFLRRHHVLSTYIMLGILIAFTVISIGLQLIS